MSTLEYLFFFLGDSWACRDWMMRVVNAEQWKMLMVGFVFKLEDPIVCRKPGIF